MTALRREMDIIANNLANMSTASFKAEKPLFTSFLNKTPRSDSVAYVEDFGTVRDLQIGTITPTDNPLDLAINGEGYFSIQTPDGIRYTRAGIFSINKDGELVTRQGYQLLDSGDNPIEIPQGTLNITVSTDGTISVDGIQLTKVGLSRFENERELMKLTEGLYETTQPPQPVQGSEIRQGMLESSNVEPIIEMTRMIDISRAYENAKKINETEDQRMRGAIRTLSGSQA
jgi:flagellar basal-body rod protein FlgF